VSFFLKITISAVHTLLLSITQCQTYK